MTSDWKIIHSELLFENRWMELHEDKVEVRSHITLGIERQTLLLLFLEFPAGHIENNEDAEKTAIRELLEETDHSRLHYRLIVRIKMPC
jgi:8-oxo-dGTP pyrophosphatase MutT (NUDIX family)